MNWLKRFFRSEPPPKIEVDTQRPIYCSALLGVFAHVRNRPDVNQLTNVQLMQACIDEYWRIAEHQAKVRGFALSPHDPKSEHGQ